MKIFTKTMLSLVLAVTAVGGAKAGNHFVVYNNGTAGSNNWDKQAVCKLNTPLAIGTQYIIKAKVKAENGNGETAMGFWVQDEASYPDTKTSYLAEIKPTTDFKEYVWYFTPDKFEGTRLVFCAGLFGGKIYIDDVTCKANAVEADELVDNGDFELPGISNWTNNWQGPSFTQDTDASNADYVMIYDNGTAGSNNWDKQAVCKLNTPLAIGTQYIIKAKVKAENGNGETAMGFWIQNETSYPDTKTSYLAEIKPTTDFKEYVWYFTPDKFEGTRLVFCAGLFGGKIYIDDVTCKANTVDPVELVDNGNISSNNISNWTNNWQGPSFTRWDYQETISVGTAGFTTFSSSKNFNVEGIVTAYTVRYAEGHALLTPVTEVPAGAGVIIEAVAGTYTVPAIESASALSDNDLLVSDGSVTGNGSTIYALGKKSDVVGFYLVKSGETVPAGKAYLNIPGTSRDFIGFSFGGETTGIDNAQLAAGNKADGAVYNLAGQRVSKPTRGLYIVNGKKVVVK